MRIGKRAVPCMTQKAVSKHADLPTLNSHHNDILAFHSDRNAEEQYRMNCKNHQPQNTSQSTQLEKKTPFSASLLTQPRALAPPPRIERATQKTRSIGPRRGSRKFVCKNYVRQPQLTSERARIHDSKSCALGAAVSTSMHMLTFRIPRGEQVGASLFLGAEQVGNVLKGWERHRTTRKTAQEFAIFNHHGHLTLHV